MTHTPGHEAPEIDALRAPCKTCAELKLNVLVLVCAHCGTPMADTCSEALRVPGNAAARMWKQRAERWKEAAKVYRTGLQHAFILALAISNKWTWRKFRRYWAASR